MVHAVVVAYVGRPGPFLQIPDLDLVVSYAAEGGGQPVSLFPTGVLVVASHLPWASAQPVGA